MADPVWPQAAFPAALLNFSLFRKETEELVSEAASGAEGWQGPVLISKGLRGFGICFWEVCQALQGLGAVQGPGTVRSKFMEGGIHLEQPLLHSLCARNQIHPAPVV